MKKIKEKLKFEGFDNVTHAESFLVHLAKNIINYAMDVYDISDTSAYNEYNYEHDIRYINDSPYCKYKKISRYVVLNCIDGKKINSLTIKINLYKDGRPIEYWVSGLKPGYSAKYVLDTIRTDVHTTKNSVLVLETIPDDLKDDLKDMLCHYLDNHAVNRLQLKSE